jgi:hypothetical protein
LKEQDRNAKTDFKNVLDLARQGGLENGFDEGDFFAGPDAVVSRCPSVMDVADIPDSERTVQDSFPKRFPNYGLRRMRQVPIMG